MEIGPIVGIRFTAVPRSQASEMKAPSIFDVDSLERLGAESFKTRNQESQGGMHDEDADLGAEEDDEFTDPSLMGRSQPARRHLNYFA